MTISTATHQPEQRSGRHARLFDLHRQTQAPREARPDLLAAEDSLRIQASAAQSLTAGPRRRPGLLRALLSRVSAPKAGGYDELFR